MTDSKRKSTIFEPLIWMSSGHMLLADGKHRYWYSGLESKKVYRYLQKMCRKNLKGVVYQYLRKNCQLEERCTTS